MSSQNIVQLRLIEMIRINIFKILLLSFGLPFFFVVSQTIRLLPGPIWLGKMSNRLAQSSMFIFTSIYIIGPVGFIILIFTFFRKNKLPFIIGIIFCINFLSLILALKGIFFLRKTAIVQSTNRGQEIINAINSYYTETKKFPDSLEQLIPKYINQIPLTDMCGSPEFNFHKTERIGDFYTGGYELSIDTPLKILNWLNWDVFVYWPNNNYPEFMQGGYTERIGTWAYVHE